MSYGVSVKVYGSMLTQKCSGLSVSTTNLTLSALSLNPVLLSKVPTSNRVGYGTDMLQIKFYS